MERDKDSPLGVTEAFTVGLFRGPRLLAAVADRVKELLKSEELETDKVDERTLPQAKDGDGDDDDQKRENKDDQQ